MAKQKILSSILMLVAALLLVPSSLVLAANPEPTYIDTTATPPIEAPTLGDDSYADWDLTNDYMTDLIQAGGKGNHDEVLGKVYMRYECGPDLLYVLVLPNSADYPGLAIQSGVAEQHWVKDNATKNKLVDDTCPSGIECPSGSDFAFIDEVGDGATDGWEGWEAVFGLTRDTTHDLNIHTNVTGGGFEDGDTAQVDNDSFLMDIDCGDPSAVSFVSLSGEANGGGFAGLALLGFAAIGLVVVTVAGRQLWRRK